MQWNRQWHYILQVFALRYFGLFFVKLIILRIHLICLVSCLILAGILPLQGRRGIPHSMVYRVGWKTRTAFVRAPFPRWICSTMQDCSWAPYRWVSCCHRNFSQQTLFSTFPKADVRWVIRLWDALWLAQDIVFQQGVMYINAPPCHSRV